ncbi:hypothetical protein [Siphonobacter aquaeclarae]|uniref:Uncharacterized protein n=1 Tax=Siphonobacter aquaeclarae TaxID=563176 RepID=A0A1G9YK41_9BACT|nr:hypothetical protein [Siphonobacter aquaeclarae]SDN09528.1 hypothetical protein SAMN04488090_4963 [Siphonobacter aquaeclarae]
MSSEDDRNTLYSLLHDLNHYYPIGFPSMRDDFPGYEELKVLVGRKMARRKENRLVPWGQLITTLAGEYPDFALTDFSHLQEPSLKLVLHISCQKGDIVRRDTFAEVYLSLLVPCFSVFFSDRFVMATDSCPVTPDCRDLSGLDTNYIGSWYRQQLTGRERELCRQLMQHVGGFYPAYKHFPFHVLTAQRIVGAVPYNCTGKEARSFEGYPISEFLYGQRNMMV